MIEEIKQYMKEHGLEAYRPKTVLFDMDGVLYDSMKFHAIAWNKAMAKYGIDMPEIEGYIYEGMRGVETITINAANNGDVRSLRKRHLRCILRNRASSTL